jgi:NTE family protein
MPFGAEGVDDKIGLALSGGGFRAALFHLGSLRRLVETGLLTRIDRISSVSGGSITAGRLAAIWSQLAADPSVEAFEQLVGAPLRQFCTRRLDERAIAEGLLSPWSTAVDEVESAYARDLFDIGLDQLPDWPIFVFGATNLQTGRSFRLSKKYMGDYLIGLVRNPQLPLAKAVAASTAFAPFLSPLVIDSPGSFEAVDGAIHAGDPAYTSRLYLSDGGTYDNLGLETVWNRCRTLLVSDAGAPFSFGGAVRTDPLRQTMRAFDIATDQNRGLRKRALIADFKSGDRAGTYWGIDTDVADYGLPDPLLCRTDRVLKLAALRTRLNPFSPQEQGELINWGYALTDAALRAHAPQLIPAGAPVAAWPEPDWRLDRT